MKWSVDYESRYLLSSSASMWYNVGVHVLLIFLWLPEFFWTSVGTTLEVVSSYCRWFNIHRALHGSNLLFIACVYCTHYKLAGVTVLVVSLLLIGCFG